MERVEKFLSRQSKTVKNVMKLCLISCVIGGNYIRRSRVIGTAIISSKRTLADTFLEMRQHTRVSSNLLLIILIV